MTEQNVNTDNLIKEYKQTQGTEFRVDLNMFFRMDENNFGKFIGFGKQTKKKCVEWIRTDHLVLEDDEYTLDYDEEEITVKPKLIDKALIVIASSKERGAIRLKRFRIPFEKNVPVFIGCYSQVFGLE